MRRPINWFVFCLSLAFLFANVSLGRKPAPLAGQGVSPVSAQLDFSHVIAADPTPPQFGYVRADGSFIPLTKQPAADPESVDSRWSAAPSAASKVPARF